MLDALIILASSFFFFFLSSLLPLLSLSFLLLALSLFLSVIRSLPLALFSSFLTSSSSVSRLVLDILPWFGISSPEVASRSGFSLPLSLDGNLHCSVLSLVDSQSDQLGLTRVFGQVLFPAILQASLQLPFNCAPPTLATAAKVPKTDRKQNKK